MKTTLWICLCFALIAFNATGQSQTQKERVLHVKGVAILKQLPELISVGINIKVEAKDYSECNDKLMSALQKAKELFVTNGIEKNLIKTNDIRVSENKIYRSGEVISAGFIGTVSLLIETPYSVEFTKNLLSGLKTDLLSLSYNITFKLSESQKEALRKEAISLAIEDAKEKAVIIAESAKVLLGRIVSIVHKDDNYVSDITRENILIRDASFDNVGYGTSTPTPTSTNEFNPKEIKIVKSVEIEWLIQDENTN